MHRTARQWLLWSCIGVVALAALAALAASGPGLLHPHGQAPSRIVRVGVYQNAPKVYSHPDGKPGGLFIDLLQPIARDQHWSLHFVSCTWKQCLQALREHRIDLMPDVAYSAERARIFDFHTVAVAHGWSEVYARPALNIRSINDLAGLRVALLREGIQEPYFHQLMHSSGIDFTPVPVDSMQAGFQAVRSGAADAVVSNNAYPAQHKDTSTLEETPILFQPVGLYFATAKGRNGNLLMAIDRHLVAWLQDPDSIYFRDLHRSMVPAPIEIVPDWLRWGLLAATGLAAMLVAASLVLRWQVRQRTAALARTSQHLDEVLRASPAVLYRLSEHDGQMMPDWISPNIQRLFGYSPDQVLKPAWWRSHLHPDDAQRAIARMENLPREGSTIHEYRFLDAQGDTRYILDEMHVTPASDGQPRTVFGTWSDLTESYEQAERVEFLTYHDSLTRLPNRLRFFQELNQGMQQARSSDSVLAVLWIDLDHFKNINDTVGHNVGDAFLQLVATALREILEPDDLLARVGGDEFAVMLSRDAGVHLAIDMTERMLSVFATPMTALGQTLALTASIGISKYPSDGDDADTLLRHAEVAMYEAKNRGRNTWHLFDDRLTTRVVERMAMENALRGAIERGELVLHYQPQVDLDTGRPVGIESLVRWNHPELGLLPPSQFIGLAEECGMINAIGAWVLAETCRQLVTWRRAGLDVPSISVNLSVRQLEHARLVDQVSRVLDDSSLDAGSLELELTESMIMRDPEQSTHALASLKELGVKLSIDDFGTGHSSLVYLKRLPLDRLKIDRAFVRDIGRNPDDEAICRTVIELARQLGLSTIAEGVEREEQVRFLRGEGCKVVQGFLYSRPLDAVALAEWWAGKQVESIVESD